MNRIKESQIRHTFSGKLKFSQAQPSDTTLDPENRLAIECSPSRKCSSRQIDFSAMAAARIEQLEKLSVLQFSLSLSLSLSGIETSSTVRIT